jgi:hypothetical protein
MRWKNIPNPFAGKSIADQATLIRSDDVAIHGLLSKGLMFAPANVKPVAVAVDVWLYQLIQAPGVLEQVLAICPMNRPMTPEPPAA